MLLPYNLVLNSGLSFECSPSPVLPLMEIVCTQSSPQVIVDIIAFGKKMRKTPIVVRNCNGYTVNRMIITYLHAAILLAERSVDVYQIDRAITSFGMSLGPFRYAGNFKFSWSWNKYFSLGQRLLRYLFWNLKANDSVSRLPIYVRAKKYRAIHRKIKRSLFHNDMWATDFSHVFSFTIWYEERQFG